MIDVALVETREPVRSIRRPGYKEDGCDMVTDAGFDDAGREADKWNTGLHQRSNFSDQRRRDKAAPDMTDQRKLAQDWITLWQSELSALAVDREVQESLRDLATLWSGTISAMLSGLPHCANVRRHDGPPGRPASADAPRTPPVAAAPDARDVEITRLTRQVSELEHRLAKLERRGDLSIPEKSRAGRKPRRVPVHRGD